jgi:hypothetical protein
MMCGHERRLMFLGVGEALLNLGLSIGLVVYYQNVICVAIGSLVSTLVFGWVFLWPWAAREAQLSGWKLARMVLGPAWLACLPLLLIIGATRFTRLVDLGDSLPFLLLQSGFACLVAMLSIWRIGLTTGERDRLSGSLSNLFGKRTPA